VFYSNSIEIFLGGMIIAPAIKDNDAAGGTDMTGGKHCTA